MTDKQLKQEILDELDFEPSVDAAAIGVAVDDGIVTLSGHVSSYAQKIAAEHAVRRVRGVRAIAQEIEIRVPFQKKTADDEIAKRVADILRWDIMLPDDAVQLTVQGGWVTLKGQVEWQYQKEVAEADVHKLSGVVGVNNQLTLKPRVQVPDLKQKIENALKRSAATKVSDIRVTVHEGGRITLEGSVHTWYERQAAKTAAWSAPGVQSVEDRLTLS
jgi:osmotically-inducible protein OsmY